MRPKQRESIFGPAAGSFLAQMTTLLASLLLVFLVLVTAVYMKRELNAFLWGEPQHAQPVLQPGQSTEIDGVKIKRIN